MNANLRPVERVNLFREVLAALESYIDERHVGDRLPSDRDLASRLRVSRPLIRQALKVLEGLGRVEMRQGVGTFVCGHAEQAAYRPLICGLESDEELVPALLGARKVIEEAVVRAAFAVRTEETMARLERALDDTTPDSDVGDVRMDLRFEASFGEICGNPVLRRLQSMVHGAWLETQRRRSPDSMPSAQAHEDHADIARSFRNGDLVQVLDLVEAHLDRVAEVREHARRAT